MTVADMQRLIKDLGYEPRQRDKLVSVGRVNSSVGGVTQQWSDEIKER